MDVEANLLTAAAIAARGDDSDGLARRLENLQTQTAAANDAANVSYERLEAAIQARKLASARWSTPSTDNLIAARTLARQALEICQKACTEETPREQFREARHEAGIAAARAKVLDSVQVRDLEQQVKALEEEVRRKKEARVLRERMRELEAQLADLDASSDDSDMKSKTLTGVKDPKAFHVGDKKF
ncbi:Hypothetical Protein FCC1311_028012 [Hondaea fermentalgiana]|uniref:Uncharacterized protein n=1 Tax=Hondaea fermentalgiana TaxID=2315210 RepID=A0A2R5G6F6_9STRA|nr:Hypothetical Protein FCC1311_028012 [Hondaea fermentalgiana]|eukprot:GBG26580.1 Hypothetical Protein FCC1311_028012 [Hondaea fermentalgiana]